MRRSFPVVLALTASAVLGGAAVAQITFVPGPPLPVSMAPIYAAAADFDRDGRKDIVVSDLSSAKVTVLLSGVDRSFDHAIDFSVGAKPHAVTTADFNNDGFPDIAVAASVASQAFVALNNGDGSFKPPFAVPINRGARAHGVAAGHFHSGLGPDLVVTNFNQSSVTVLLNDGSASFSKLGVFPAGKGPNFVAAGDLNGDGLDDIVVLNTGSSGADDVSILLNTGAGSFSSPINFVVGVGANSISLVDINGDGALDILVLNGGVVPSTPNVFSVSVLLNDTHTVNGKKVGTGFFTTLPPITLNCPTRIGGVLIKCSPNSLAAGDFNGDGLLDFAVSFYTWPVVVGSPQTVGVVSAYAGRGDGTFDFATQVQVSYNPQGLAAADFTGDGLDDVGVAEKGSRTVRILRSLPPIKRSRGDPCQTGPQCESGFCSNEVCCESQSCSNGQRCDIPANAGACSDLGQDGARCGLPEQCQSGFCVDGFCCVSDSCPDGQFCNSGQCAQPAPNGTPCQDLDHGAQCASGFCFDEFCCSTPTCVPPLRCNIPEMEGTCTAPMPPGSQCTAPGQCDTGFCVDGACCVSESCPAGQSCNVLGFQGNCTPIPTPTPTLTRTPTATLTPTPQPNGAHCANRLQCLSGQCVDGACCGVASCPSGQRCDMPGNAGTCAPRGGINDTCTLSGQCTTNYCLGPNGECVTACDDKNPGACQLQPTPTPTATATPVSGGGACTTTAQCQVPLFCNKAENVCCASLDPCPTGYSCRLPGYLGQCAPLPTPTPTLRPSGTYCTQGAECASGYCTDTVCCDESNCAPGRCDIPGSKGTCADLVGFGGTCEITVQCSEGLQCLAGTCSPPYTYTPTLLPNATDTPAPGPQIIASRSGGCSVGNGTDAPAPWMLGLVPFVLWLRRCSEHATRRAVVRVGRK